MALQLPRWKFTTDQYEQMGVEGIFNEDDRVELLDGDIVQMSPIGHRHARVVRRLNMLLAPVCAGRALVQVRSPLKLDIHWEPQPDLVVLRQREDDYATGHPTAADVLLLIEVADSSRDYDLAKWPAYARNGIQEAWLVDINDEVVLCHREPVAEEYRLVRVYRRGEAIRPLALADQALTVDAILG